MTEGFLTFALLSGTGWVLDVVLTVVLVSLGLTPFVASALGAATAVTFVYVASRLFLFATRRLGHAGDYGLYMLWQVFAITLASLAVAAIGHALEPVIAARRAAMVAEPLALGSGIGKVLVTPITLAANFMFLRWLTGRPSPAARES